MTRVAWLIVPATVVLAHTASADPITVVTQDNRFTSVGTSASPQQLGSSASSSDTLRSTLSSPAATTTAVLTSSFADPSHWFASGTTSGFSTGPSTIAHSDFSVAFAVTSPVSYSFDAEFDESSSSLPPNSRCCIQVITAAFLGLVVGPGIDAEEPALEPVFRVDNNPGGPDVDSAISRALVGMLRPGEYRFNVLAISITPGFQSTGAEGIGNADFRFTFDFAPAAAPTPEPASLFLLGTAIVGMFAFRSRAAGFSLKR